MVRTSTTAGGGYAAFGDVGEIPLGERRAGLIDRRVLESFMGAVGSVRAVRMSGGTRPNFISSIDQPLSIPMLDPRMMFRLQFRLLVVVCLFGLLEDIHQVLTLLKSVSVSRRGILRLTVLMTFPDLLMIVTVSMRGILAVMY